MKLIDFLERMIDMNIQQLRYVVAIANSGTFREAASKLFVSQPSLSVAIKDLEGELGFQIFTRTTTGAVLTSHGMTFYEKALEVVKSFDELLLSNLTNFKTSIINTEEDPINVRKLTDINIYSLFGEYISQANASGKVVYKTITQNGKVL